jgi:hypothetical protein
LKKRTKKLLLVLSRARQRVRDSTSKSFCFFFQKEALPCLASASFNAVES